MNNLIFSNFVTACKSSLVHTKGKKYKWLISTKKKAQLVE